MMRAILAGLGVLAAVSAPANAEELHIQNCLHGCPTGAPVTNDLIVREIYVLSSNDLTKFADWAAYRVTEDEVQGREDPSEVRFRPCLDP